MGHCKTHFYMHLSLFIYYTLMSAALLYKLTTLFIYMNSGTHVWKCSWCLFSFFVLFSTNICLLKCQDVKRYAGKEIMNSIYPTWSIPFRKLGTYSETWLIDWCRRPTNDIQSMKSKWYAKLLMTDRSTESYLMMLNLLWW